MNNLELINFRNFWHMPHFLPRLVHAKIEHDHACRGHLFYHWATGQMCLWFCFNNYYHTQELILWIFFSLSIQAFEFEVEACSTLKLTCFNKLRLMGDDISGKCSINVSCFVLPLCSSSFKVEKEVAKYTFGRQKILQVWILCYRGM